MRKNVTPRGQLTMFNICDPIVLKDTEEYLSTVPGKNIINLRQELKNEIPSTTYLTHAIHNVYPAKFIPQVPRFVIKKFNLKAKVILDPFAGSGTTAVESLLTGNSNISNDINPITKILVEVKTLKLNPRDYFYYLDRLNYHTSSMAKNEYPYIPKWENLGYWYPAEILSSLTKIWGYIHNIDEDEANIKNILKVSALYISRKYSYGEDESPKLFKSKQKTEKMKELVDKFHKLGEELLRAEMLGKARQYLDCIIQFNQCMKQEYQRIYSFKKAENNFC